EAVQPPAAGTSSRKAAPATWGAAVAQATASNRDLSGDDLDRLLATSEPTMADVRSLAAYLFWAARRSPPPPALVQRLNEGGRFPRDAGRVVAGGGGGVGGAEPGPHLARGRARPGRGARPAAGAAVPGRPAARARHAQLHALLRRGVERALPGLPPLAARPGG